MLRGRNKGTPTPADDKVVNWETERLATVQASNRHMFEQQDGCDIFITVKGPLDMSETRIGAHRYVLCSRSPVFYKQLWTGKTASADKKLKENDIAVEIFREILRFMYTDDVRLTPSTALQVLQGAKKYHITSLVARCQDFIESSFTDDGVCPLLDRCIALREEDLVVRCLRYIEQHTAAVFQAPSFLELGVDALSRVVARDTLGQPEIDVFQACVAWAHRRCASTSPTDADLRRLLDPILPLIRFPTMTTHEFASYVVPMNILSDAETCNIYKYFTCPEKPPKRFLTTKRMRPANNEDATPTAPAAAAVSHARQQQQQPQQEQQQQQTPVVQPRLLRQQLQMYPNLHSPIDHVDICKDGVGSMGLCPSAPDLLSDGLYNEPPPKYHL